MSSLRPTSRLFGRALFGDQDLQLRRLAFAAGAILVFLIPAAGLATMQRSPVTQPYVDLQHEAIRYYTTKTTDPVAKLQARVERGEVQLQYDEKNGYLASLLSELDIDVSSQLLVSSKTSLQIDHISPTTPRAIYFNDAVYVGWVQGARPSRSRQSIRSWGQFSTRSITSPGWGRSSNARWASVSNVITRRCRAMS